MGKNKLPNELLGDIYRRVNGIINKIENGGLDYRRVVNGLQALSEGRMEKKWREEDGIIYFSVTSDGTTGRDWIKRLKKRGIRIEGYATELLRSLNFKPTTGVTTEVAVLKGVFFTDDDRITKKIRAEADKRKLLKPNAEVACLIREVLSNGEIEIMGLQWITIMHEPINDSDDYPCMLSVSCEFDIGGGSLAASCGGPDDSFGSVDGFAFAVSPQ